MRPAHEDASVRVAICTFEKANALLNQMMSEGRSSEVGIVVVDELHMLSDDTRGPLLELFITKLRYMAHKPQLVGLSATLPNLSVIATWLGASLFTTDFRPVELRQRYVIGLEVSPQLVCMHLIFLSLLRYDLQTASSSGNCRQCLRGASNTTGRCGITALDVGVAIMTCLS